MRLSSSTSGMWKRGMVWIVRHRQTKEPDTDRPNLNHRATSRLHHFRCKLTPPKTHKQLKRLGMQRFFQEVVGRILQASPGAGRLNEAGCRIATLSLPPAYQTCTESAEEPI
jgi:hypothetical protein